jgi:hypothetical protein
MYSVFLDSCTSELPERTPATVGVQYLDTSGRITAAAGGSLDIADGLGIPKVCEDLSREVCFEFWANIKGLASCHWTYTMYAQGMDHSLKQIEVELKEVNQNTVSITDLIHQLEDKLDKMAEQTKNYEGTGRPVLDEE